MRNTTLNIAVPLNIINTISLDYVSSILII